MRMGLFDSLRNNKSQTEVEAVAESGHWQDDALNKVKLAVNPYNDLPRDRLKPLAFYSLPPWSCFLACWMSFTVWLL